MRLNGDFSPEKRPQKSPLKFQKRFPQSQTVLGFAEIHTCLFNSLKEIEEKYLQENESMNYERVASNEKNRCVCSLHRPWTYFGET